MSGPVVRMKSDPRKSTKRRKKAKPKEQALVNAVIRYLGLRGFFVWRQNQGAMSGVHKGRKWFVRFAHVAGISDVIGIAPDGRFVAIECKIAPNKPTEEQKQFLREVARLGGIVLLAYSIDDVVEMVGREFPE